MKNKDKKIISLMVIMTLVITMVIGPINPVSIVKAEDNKYVKIKDILNEDELLSDDEKLILSKTGEKISDNEFKVTLNIKGNNDENMNLNNAIIEDTLNSGFEIVKDSIEIEKIQDEESIKVNTDETNQKISIELGNIDTKEIEVSFLVKVKEDIEVKENTDVSLETKLIYNELENEEKVEVNFPKLILSFEEVIDEENIKNEVIEGVVEDIVQDSTINDEEEIKEGEYKEDIESFAISNVTVNKLVRRLTDTTFKESITIEPEEEFEIQLTITNNSDRKKKFNITDYIDTSKFTYMSRSVSDNGTLANSNSQIIWKNIEVEKRTTKTITYRLKANEGVNSITTTTNPSDEQGEISEINNNSKEIFKQVSITINAPQNSDSGSGGGNSGSESTLNSDSMEKYVSEIDSNGEFTITLKADWNITREEDKYADIVLVIDKSTSMVGKLDTIKDVAKSFSEDILTGTNGNVRIAVVEFSGSVSTYDFSSNIETVTSNIMSVNMPSRGDGTNAQAAILAASNMLTQGAQGVQARPNANQYVVFFTDGLPNRPLNTNSEQVAIQEYKNHFKTWDQLGSNVTHPNAKFYSIGLFTDDKSNNAVNFLKQIQNVINPNNFGIGNYYTNNLSDINDIYNTIKSEISAEINNTIATNVVIKDIVTEDFQIVDGSYLWEGLNGASLTNVEVDKNNNTIQFNIESIQTASNTNIGGVQVSFRIKPRDEYFSGENIPTNVEATIKYNRGNEITFKQEPVVTIQPIYGSIEIKKTVEGQDNINDEFNIQINGIGNFQIKAGESNKQIKEVILKKEDTNTDYLTDAQKAQVLVIGDYTVKETDISTGYSFKEISINNEVYEENNATFTIDKDNKDIKIDILNKIEVIQGSITIKKEIVSQNIFRQWVTNNQVNQNDRFSISIIGTEKYTVDLAGNSQTILNFYLKGNGINISTNTDTDVNYLTMGEYSVKELIPMNYEQVGVYIENSDGKLTELGEEEKFTIDEKNIDITIIVRNKLVNENYWFDKVDAENVFKCSISNTLNAS